ncbi:MAG: DUF2007 domain-containing protein [Burkholderiales bacterium]|nr:DUF2007 domain-containing protein [Opitutaceae bacterium]
MVVIASFPTVDQAHLLAARLRSAGIACELRDENTLTMNWTYSLAIGGVKVAVPDSDEEDALAILADAPSEEGLLVCPECGSGDVTIRTLSPAGGVFLVSGVPLPMAMQKADCRACGRAFEVDAHPDANQSPQSDNNHATDAE